MAFTELDPQTIENFQQYGALVANGIWGNADDFEQSEVIAIVLIDNKKSAEENEYKRFQYYAYTKQLKILHASNNAYKINKHLKKQFLVGKSEVQHWIYLTKSQFEACANYKDYPIQFNLPTNINDIADWFYKQKEFKTEAGFNVFLQNVGQTAKKRAPAKPLPPSVPITKAAETPNVLPTIEWTATQEQFVGYLNALISTELYLDENNIKNFKASSDKITVRFANVSNHDLERIVSLLKRQHSTTNDDDIKLSAKKILKKPTITITGASLAKMQLEMNALNKIPAEETSPAGNHHLTTAINIQKLRDLQAKWVNEKQSRFIFQAEKDHKELKIKAYASIINALQKDQPKPIKEIISNVCTDNQTYQALFHHYTRPGNFFDCLLGLRSRDTLIKECGLTAKDITELNKKLVP